jgi:hypothetical protein
MTEPTADLRSPRHEPTWKCRIGRHQWTRFGDCSQCGKVPLLTLLFATHPASLRYAAQRQAGLALRADLAALGTDASPELCTDAMTNGWADSLRDLARERAPR